ncbi:BlaI/MecI/CopY family transcriptional regulator [Kitasatospora sp. DSM 101779]|uniref:BlaI/MecI/CopY family transcriptional regulator n=1 Tax=Kitasatospora sp. DSM 101779 TaxID=2853165 RepID=UPI0021D8956A|nr:BlaI/MecI/CopY family transcriptional regulator [Kitasatospora sp. DSM 101779]MCU7820647.1 BlaI/MecI/CopY family transcriptional regulator [Kitasatospora sp. DSM 101779]
MRGFGQLEAEIMERLWSWGRPATVREIVDDLNVVRPVAYTTVNTVADILHRKGCVHRSKEGRAWVYEPVRSRESYTAEIMRQVLGEAADARAALLLFVDGMDDGHAALLREALAGRVPGGRP